MWALGGTLQFEVDLRMQVGFEDGYPAGVLSVGIGRRLGAPVPRLDP